MLDWQGVGTLERIVVSPPELRDEELVVRLRRGDGAALRQLVERHRGPLYGYLVRMLASREDAEDLFQEAFLRVVRHAERFDEQQRFKPWLYAIATNLVKNKYRSRSYRNAVSLDQDGEEAGGDLASRLAGRSPRPMEEAVRSELCGRVRDVVQGLPEKGRAALVLFYYQGLSYQEISEVLEVPLGTVKSRIHNALSRLSRDLQPEEGAL